MPNFEKFTRVASSGVFEPPMARWKRLGVKFPKMKKLAVTKSIFRTNWPVACPKERAPLSRLFLPPARQGDVPASEASSKNGHSKMLCRPSLSKLHPPPHGLAWGGSTGTG